MGCLWGVMGYLGGSWGALGVPCECLGSVLEVGREDLECLGSKIGCHGGALEVS